MDYCHGQLAALTLDYHFRARADASQHRREVAGGFLFRDVDHIVSHSAIIPLSFLLIFGFPFDCHDREPITMSAPLPYIDLPFFLRKRARLRHSTTQ